MFTYTAKELASELHTHYRVSEDSGMVVEVFGWDNRGDHENLREVLHEAIDYKLNIVRKYAMETIGWNMTKLTNTFFKTRSVREALAKATEDHNDALKLMDTLKALQTRIHDALDLPQDKRFKLSYRSNVSDALLEECQRYIKVSLLDMDREYTMESPLTSWNPATHVVYFVESDFSISEWRVGVAGYENRVEGQIVQGIGLFYYVHNFDNDHTHHFIDYNAENGNFEYSGTLYTSGEYIPQCAVYHADINDAIKIAKKGIADLNKKNRDITKAANQRLEALAA